MNTPSSSSVAVMRMRSPRMAPPDTGLEGSTAMMPTVLPWRAHELGVGVDQRRLARPGGPVKPMTRACPRCGCMACSRRGAAADSRSSSVTAREMARRSPARMRSIRRARSARSSASGAVLARGMPCLIPSPAHGRNGGETAVPDLEAPTWSRPTTRCRDRSRRAAALRESAGGSSGRPTPSARRTAAPRNRLTSGRGRRRGRQR